MIKKIKIIIIGNILSNKLNLMNKVILCTICKTNINPVLKQYVLISIHIYAFNKFQCGVPNFQLTLNIPPSR